MLVEATLTLTVQSNEPIYENRLVIKRLDAGTWQEGGVTWATRPTLGDDIGSSVVPAGRSTIATIDVTAYVRGREGRLAFGLSQLPDAAPARIEVGARCR